MKKIKFLLLILLLMNQSANSQIAWSWAASGGNGINGNSYSECHSVDFDQFQNTYVAGCISSPAKVGALIPLSYGRNDIIISKYDKYGTPIWAKTAGGSFNDMAKSIRIGSDGFIYVCGHFNGTANFDNIIINGNGESFFVAKMDTSGAFVWVKHGSNSGVVNSTYEPYLTLCTDKTNNLYLGGYCKSNAQLIDTIYNDIPTAIFITQLDTSGNMKWTKFIKGNTNSNGPANGGVNLITDNSNNLFYSASIPRVDTIIGGQNSLTFYSNLAYGKILNNGNFAWQKEFGDSIHYNWLGSPRGIGLDANNNIYTCGTYFKKFLPDISQLEYTGGFTAKINSTNGNLIHSKTFPSLNNSSSPYFSGADYDYNNNIIYSGTLCGKVDFGGTTIQPISTSYDCDNFVSSFDTAGNLNYVIRYGYPGIDYIRSTKSNESMYAVVGGFKDSISFDNNNLYAFNPTTNSFFYFVSTQVKIKNPASIVVPNTNIYLNIYPNPTSNRINIESNYSLKDAKISIISSNGKTIKVIANNNANYFDISSLSSGVYYISIKNEHYNLTKKIIKTD